MLITRFLPKSIPGFLIVALIGLLAPLGHAAEAYSEKPGVEGDGNHPTGPEYKIDPDLTDKGNPKGKSFEFSLRLADSKVFRGDDTTLEPVRYPHLLEVFWRRLLAR